MVQYVRGALATLPYLGFLAADEPESEERLVRTARLWSTWLGLIFVCRVRLDTSTSLPLEGSSLSSRSSRGACTRNTPIRGTFISAPRHSLAPYRLLWPPLFKIGRWFMNPRPCMYHRTRIAQASIGSLNRSRSLGIPTRAFLWAAPSTTKDRIPPRHTLPRVPPYGTPRNLRSGSITPRRFETKWSQGTSTFTAT